MATIISNSKYIEIDGRTAIALSDNAKISLIKLGVRVSFTSGSHTDIPFEGTTADGTPTATAQELYTWFKSKGFSSGGTGPSDGVQSVTGQGVNNSDAANPVISYPSPGDIGAATAASVADKVGSVQESGAGGLVTNILTFTESTEPSEKLPGTVYIITED